MQKTLLGLAALPFLSMFSSASETSWMELDKDIANLATTTNAVGDGAALSGFIKNYYTSNSDADVGGWKFDGVRVNVKGGLDKFKYKVSFDMKSGTPTLKDAFVSWEYEGGITATWGQFKRPFLHSFTTSSNKRLFVSSTANAANEKRDNGVRINGAIGETMDWSVAATNGDDSIADEMYLTARAAFVLVGEGGFNKFEGGRGDNEGMNASAGISYAEDGSAFEEFHKVGLEVAGNMDNLSFHVDYVMYSDEGVGSPVPDDKFTGTSMNDTSPLGVTLSYLISDDMEVAIRHEDFDDVDDTTRLTLGFNYYAIAPNTAVWQLNYSDTSSDAALLEGEIIQLGLVFSF